MNKYVLRTLNFDHDIYPFYEDITMTKKQRTTIYKFSYTSRSLLIAMTLTPSPTIASEVEMIIERVGGRNVLEQHVTPNVEDFTFMGSLAANKEKFQPLAQVQLSHCRIMRLVCIAPALAILNVELVENQSKTMIQEYLKPRWGRAEYHEKGCPVMHEISTMIAISSKLKRMEADGRSHEADLIAARTTLVISAFGGIHNSLVTPECRELFVRKPYLGQAYLDQAARLFLKLKDENRVEWLDLYGHSSISRIREELSMSIDNLKSPTIKNHTTNTAEKHPEKLQSSH